MAGETVIVNTTPEAPDETPPQTSSTPSPQQIDQATQFGEMREAFRQAQNEAEQTRSEVRMLQADRESLTREVSELRNWRESVQTAARQEQEAEQKREEEVTVIAPPAPEKPKEPEAPPKPKQNRLSLILFGRDDEE